MSTYAVDLSQIPPGRTLPPLLVAFADWVRTLEHGSLGWFDALAVEAIPEPWHEGAAERLRGAGYSFLALPDGSLIALLDTGREGAPMAVVLLGSEGEARTLAGGFEEFLTLWSKGDTGIDDLEGGSDDDAEQKARLAAGRREMKAWLKRQKVKPTRTPDFDFQAWLDGAPAGGAEVPAAGEIERPVPEVFARLPPKFRRLAELHGRRADDPRVVSFVTEELRAKVPTSATDQGGAKEVKAAKLGFTLWFGHDFKNEAFPLLARTAKSYVPYLSEIALNAAWPESLPFGLGWKQTEEGVAASLGEPRREPLFDDDPDSPIRTWWEVPLDPSRTKLQIAVKKKGLELVFRIVQARELESRYLVADRRATLGLFVAWALSRGLLDESRFARHQDLVDRIKSRREKGSALVDAALSRGLWDSDLAPDSALRRRAARLFKRMGGFDLRGDLMAIFGKRMGKYGHEEPALDDDTWEAVDRATPILDERFAPWSHGPSGG